MSRLTRDGTAEPVSRDQILRHARGQGNIIFPVQLTTSRIGNLTRLIHTLLYVMTIHTYIHTLSGTWYETRFQYILHDILRFLGYYYTIMRYSEFRCKSYTRYGLRISNYNKLVINKIKKILYLNI